MLESSLFSAPPTKRISLTPLIDVVFILLMFFMLTSSFSQYKSIIVETATASTGTTETPEKPNVLVLHSNGLISLKGENSQDNLDVSVLLPLLDKTQSSIIFPEANVSVQQIVQHLETLQRAGFTHVNLGDAISPEPDGNAP